MGLDEWIRLHSTAGLIDEDGCYADARFRISRPAVARRARDGRIRRRRVPTSSRVGPSQPGQDRRDPPSWKIGTDPACKADLVFVQFPDNCIRDATGVWLKAYVLDGIRFILSHAHPTKTKKVVINLSYGPTTGPHDGTAELEAAMTALTAEFNGTTNKPKLEIVLAAGNAYLSEGHVVFRQEHQTQPDYVEWTWRVPPDNTVLCFAEIWMKKADADGVDGHAHITWRIYAPFHRRPPPLGAPIPPAGVDVPLSGVPTRCGCFKSSPPSLRRASRPRTWGLDDQGRRYRAKCRGPCLCGTQRSEHGRTHGRQAFIFRRPEVGQ